MARRPKTPPIPRHARELDTGFTHDGLVAELDDFAKEGGPKLRSVVLTHLKAQLDAAMLYTRKRFDHGRLDGLETAHMIAAIHDKIITALWKFATRHIVVAENPTERSSDRIYSLYVVGFRVESWSFQPNRRAMFETGERRSDHIDVAFRYAVLGGR